MLNLRILIILIVALMSAGCMGDDKRGLKQAEEGGGGATARCGDGICASTESTATCPQDCGEGEPPPCGDGLCDANETTENCPADCDESEPLSCGNAVCDGEETVESCPEDCPGEEPLPCGNGVCDVNETIALCPADCQAIEPGAVCGNNVCESGESLATCPADCPTSEMPDELPPLVVSTNPTNNSNNVNETTQITITFSEPIDPRTLNTGTFHLTNVFMDSVRGSVSIDNETTATFTPADQLSLSTAYRVTLTTAIADLSGNHLADATSFIFVVRFGTFQTPIVLEGLNTSVGSAEVSYAGNQAMVVWAQPAVAGAVTSIYSRSFLNNSGWHSINLIENMGQTAQAPNVSTNRLGHAIAVWEQNFGSFWYTAFNRFVPEEGWSNFDFFGIHTVRAIGPQVVLDINGNAFAAWKYFTDDGRWEIGAERFDIDESGWTRLRTLSLLDPAFNAEASNPRVTVDNNGNGYFVWHEPGDATQNYNLDFIKYSAGDETWRYFPVDEGERASSALQDMATSSDGYTIVVWPHIPPGSAPNVLVRSYQPGSSPAAIGTWGTIVNISGTDSNDDLNPKIVMNSDGDALLVWQKSNAGNWSIMASEYRRDTNQWSPPTMIEQRSNYQTLDLAADPLGNAMLVWTNFDSGENNVYAKRYRRGDGWRSSQTVDSSAPGDVQNPRVSVNVYGQAMIIWRHFDGTRWSLWSRAYN